MGETREHNGYVETLRGLSEHITDVKEDLARAGVPDRLAKLGSCGGLDAMTYGRRVSDVRYNGRMVVPGRGQSRAAR
jgi:hypothetical protein